MAKTAAKPQGIPKAWSVGVFHASTKVPTHYHRQRWAAKRGRGLHQFPSQRLPNAHQHSRRSPGFRSISPSSSSLTALYRGCINNILHLPMFTIFAFDSLIDWTDSSHLSVESARLATTAVRGNLRPRRMLTLLPSMGRGAEEDAPIDLRKGPDGLCLLVRSALWSFCHLQS